MKIVTPPKDESPVLENAEPCVKCKYFKPAPETAGQGGACMRYPPRVIFLGIEKVNLGGALRQPISRPLFKYINPTVPNAWTCGEFNPQLKI